jgi:hypothetical protein
MLSPYLKKGKFLFFLFSFLFFNVIHAQSSDLIVIEASLENKNQIIDKLPQEANLLIVPSDKNGWSLLANYLYNHQNIREIHLFPKVQGQEFVLGKNRYNKSSLSSEPGLAMLEGSYQTTPFKLLIYHCSTESSHPLGAMVDPLTTIGAFDVALPSPCNDQVTDELVFGPTSRSNSTVNSILNETP